MVFKRWQITAGIALLVASTVASAISLGRVRGTALIGRSLDLSVQGSLDTQEALPESNCLAVEVFYGDTRISPNAVNVNTERTSSGELRIRVRSNTIVDEPVVTLFVRSSCPGAMISRRYVLLAEALTDAEPTAAAPISPATIAPTSPLASPRIAFGGATAPSSGSASGTPAISTQERRAERAAKRQAQREARQQRQAEVASEQPTKDVALAASPRARESASVMRKSATTATSRLKIDLVDFTIADPSLRNSSELSSSPATDEAVRRQAQALWRMLNATPEDAMREAQRLEGVESQLRKAQEQSKRQSQEITTLNAQLQDAQKARNLMVIALGLLAIAAVAAGAFLWKRARSNGQPWWGSSAAKSEPKDERHLWKHLGETPDSAMSPLQKPAPSSFSPEQISPDIKAQANDAQSRTGVFAASALPNSQRANDKPSSFQDSQPPFAQRSASAAKVATSPMSPSRGSSLRPVDSTPQPAFQDSISGRGGKNSGFGSTDFSPNMFASPRVVAAEELFDIQEQADFFLSLGQPDQAIEVLKNHITDNVETSALAYMDLFNIYHRTNRKSDYAELREEFNRVFNAQVPEFAKYGAQSNGLEDFPQVLSSIQSIWSRPQQAQDVIEESIFRQPGGDHQILDMAAYRELMLLYALAKELSRPDAAYSMLPISTQSLVLPGGGVSLEPDVDLGDGLVLSTPTDSMIDLLSPEDRTVSLPEPLLKASDAYREDGGLDFDLSQSAELSIIKTTNPLKAPKKL